ncbi:MAG: hypothetical protein SPJ19_05620 [Candidatus Borkfalkiaceae bacterium]|nr:hypothetical protein [Christensenellaceae bacterium]
MSISCSFKKHTVPRHRVIEEHIKEFGKNYRFETKKNPIPELQDREKDNTDLVRK